MQISKLIPWLLTSVILVVLLVWVVSAIGGEPEEDESTKKGVEYIQMQEEKDPQEVIASLRGDPAAPTKPTQPNSDPSETTDGDEPTSGESEDAAAAQREQERQALRTKIENGEVDVWTLFDEYVILGDSRAVGFYYFDFLDKSRVLADGGHTIRNTPELMSEIVALNPKHIYLCYGLNDVSIGYWDTPEEYVEEFRTLIESLRTELPNATIIISSILPARDPAFDLSSRWYHIPEFSAAVEEMCQEMGVAFANNDEISEIYGSQYWQPDGIHVRPEFYPYWATNLIIATMQGDAGDV